jgi:sugar/nucleoside kinase (ribokinase family)
LKFEALAVTKESSIDEAAMRFLLDWKCEKVIITLGSKGAIAYDARPLPKNHFEPGEIIFSNDRFLVYKFYQATIACEVAV